VIDWDAWPWKYLQHWFARWVFRWLWATPGGMHLWALRSPLVLCALGPFWHFHRREPVR
jgi:hypothetical protein